MVFSTIFNPLKDDVLDLIFPPKCAQCGKRLVAEPGRGFDVSTEVRFDVPSIAHLRRHSLHHIENQDKAPFHASCRMQSPHLMQILSSFYCTNCVASLETGAEVFNGPIIDAENEVYASSDEQGVYDRQMRCLTRSGVRYLTAAAPYEGLLKESIHLLKYRGKIALAKPLGWILFATFLERYPKVEQGVCQDGSHGIDVIAPIPLYRWRMFKRGFNQAYLLIREFTSLWQTLFGSKAPWFMESRLLRRSKNTKTQTGFTREERLKNMQNAFRVTDGSKVNGKNILLVDDVHTTGATTNEAAKVLYDAGAASVDVLVLAKA